MIILSAARSRPDRMVLPLPKSLKGGAAAKAINSLIAVGLVQEVDASVNKDDPIWRKTGDGHGVTLIASDAADAAIEGGSITLPAEAPAAAPQRATRAKKAKVAAKAEPKAKKAHKAAAVPAGLTRHPDG